MTHTQTLAHTHTHLISRTHSCRYVVKHGQNGEAVAARPCVYVICVPNTLSLSLSLLHSLSLHQALALLPPPLLRIDGKC